MFIARPGLWSYHKRLARLKLEDDSYRFIALDHGLSQGDFGGNLDVESMINKLADTKLSGYVVRPGRILQSIAPTTNSSLIVQTFGRCTVSSDSSKGKLADVSGVVKEFSPEGVALELDMENTDVSVLESCASQVAEARYWGIPVMIMVTPALTSNVESGVAKAIVSATELGADIIKVGLPNSISDFDLSKLKGTIERSAPVVLAGGTNPDSFERRLHIAKRTGFSGYCLGREIFNHEMPALRIAEIDSVLFN